MTANVSGLVPSLATQIVGILNKANYPIGHRLTEQALCDQLGVSRSPVRKALRVLESVGALTSHPNRGFFVAKAGNELQEDLLPSDSASDEPTYLQIAGDYLEGKLDSEFSESELMHRYAMSRAKVQRVLNRMASEAIVDRKPGRGWVFRESLKTLQSYNESYRFRMAIEPASVLEPTYKIDPAAFAICRKEQVEMLEGGIDRWSSSELFRVGVNLHETVIGCAGNHFFIDAARHINRLRRIVEYKQNVDRSRLHKQCEEHLRLLDLLESGDRLEASYFLREHLNNARIIKTQAARKVMPSSITG